MKVILTRETGFPFLSVVGKTELVSLSQLPRLLRLGLLTTEAELRRDEAITEEEDRPHHSLTDTTAKLTQLTDLTLSGSLVTSLCQSGFLSTLELAAGHHHTDTFLRVSVSNYISS